MKSSLLLITLLALGGCATSPHYVPQPQSLEVGRLPRPDVALNVPHLRPCTDAPDRTLHLNANHPVTVLVHGCKGSAGRFRALAQLYAFHGQQAVCFSYNDRDSLITSSGQLISALDALQDHMHDHQLTVIGHSMGGLVARKAMERDRQSAWRSNPAQIQLVTVSAPLAGIRAASPCGSTALHWLSLGVVPAACWIATGDNWDEITPQSSFIRQPGPLLPSVQRYLKVVTDERGSCRRSDAEGRCLESDRIFSLAEQYQPVIDDYPQLVNVVVKAGHVEIVGDTRVIPRKLLAILQQQGLLAATPPDRRAALEQLLVQLYSK
jgi:pimeloyl-ACP methyl ester carboxylesterase